MTSILLLLRGISIIYAHVYFGLLLERRWSLSRYYISPALFSGGIGALLWIVGAHFADFRAVLHPVVGRSLITVFLFSVGFKIGMIYTKRHHCSLFVLFAFVTALLLVFEIPGWLFWNRYKTAFTVFGFVSFAWNEEWLSYIRFDFPEAEIRWE